jgi:hypothetical protein
MLSIVRQWLGHLLFLSRAGTRGLILELRLIILTQTIPMGCFQVEPQLGKIRLLTTKTQ